METQSIVKQRTWKRLIIGAFLAFLILASLAAISLWLRQTTVGKQEDFKGQFNGQRAWDDVQFQVSLGPRTPGSQAHFRVAEWITNQLQEVGWKTEVQEADRMGQHVRNVVSRWGEGEPWIILGAHYDSRILADRDPDPSKRQMAVPGANDGASGVAVLLELGRVLPHYLDEQMELGKGKQVWLVFFDAEDNGNLEGWDWILGSSAFVESLRAKPDSAVIIDMIGDTDLNVYMEQNSDSSLTAEIWAQAAELGYEDYFIPQYRYRILDDHLPFLRAGIPAADLIDFDYAYWHTSEDTLDKVSAQSLQIVGEILFNWVIK